MKEEKEEKPNQTCACCGKRFYQSDYSALCDAITKHKPACSYECNKALGQIHPNQIAAFERSNQ